MDLPKLLEECHRIAEAAGRAILEIYHTDFPVKRKADKSPLTEADVAAHHLIVDALLRLDPALPCLSEEEAAVDYASRAHWSRYWLVDPLDGTKEFVNRNDEFTVNIALIHENTPILGVVHAPALQLSYLAAAGEGASRLRDGKREPVHVRRTPARPRLVVSKSHRDADLEQLLTALPPHDAISRGSSLKFCLVAEGTADCYPRTGQTSEWDTAAGHCIVEQAGGQVRTLHDWMPLRYNTKFSLLNPGFVAIGDASYGWHEKFAGQRS